MKSFTLYGLRVLGVLLILNLLGCPLLNQSQDDDDKEDDTTGSPALAVYQDTIRISPDDTVDFGSIVRNDSITLDFVIGNEGNETNAGDGVLELNGTPTVTVDDLTYFTVNSYPPASINVGSSSDLSITFSSPTVGTFDTTVQIDSNDPDHPSFTFTISCECTAEPEPEIAFIGPDGVLTSDSGSYTFDNTPRGSSTSANFTIENIGAGDLELSGSPIVELMGTDPDQFSVTTTPGTPVSPSGVTAFTINFEPDSGGTKTAEVSITNNDDDENPFTFAISGYAAVPEVEVLQGDSPVPNSTGSYTFTDTFVDYSREVTFEISNSGDAELNLSNSPPVIMSGNANDFSIQTQPATPIAPGASESFILEFAPATAGSKSINIAILNNDSDESPYEFTVTGEALESPDINVLHGGTTIPDGTGEVSFEDTMISETSSISTFTVVNTGTGTLNLTGSPHVTIDGTHADLFSVTTQPTSPLNPAGDAGDSSTFAIEFAPDSEGMKNATVHIYSNDPDLVEADYDFTINGTGIEWAGVQQVDSNSSDVGSYSSIARTVDNIYMSYHDDGNDDLKFARSEDSGATWPESYIRTVDSIGNVGVESKIDVFMGTIAITYRDVDNDTLKLALSSDYGDTWSPQTLDDSVNVSGNISMDMLGSSIYISYYDSTNDNLLFYKYDTSDSSTSSTIVDATGNVGIKNSIAYDAEFSNVYIAYLDSDNNRIQLARSVNEGSDWTLHQVATDIGSGGGDITISAPSGNEVHICYRDETDTMTKRLMHTVSTDGGSNFSTPVVVDDSNPTIGMSFSRPGFNTSQDTIFIAYSDDTDEEVQLATSTDGGSTWSTSVIHQVVDLSLYGICMNTVSNTSSDTTLYVSFSNYNSTLGDDLLFAKSVDGGNTW